MCGPTTRIALFEGMEAWLDNFIPFHDTCAWTVHEITNHVVGADRQGIWATCYGWIRWTMKDTPGYINRAEVLFRDRLREDGGTWRIARRTLRLLSSSRGRRFPAGYTLVQSVLDLADWTWRGAGATFRAWRARARRGPCGLSGEHLDYRRALSSSMRWKTSA